MTLATSHTASSSNGETDSAVQQLLAYKWSDLRSDPRVTYPTSCAHACTHTRMYPAGLLWGGKQAVKPLSSLSCYMCCH